jgi:hypothetical protein
VRDLGSSPLPIGVLLLLAGSVYFVRVVLIVIGRLKSPLLRRFEIYDDTPRDFNSLRDLLLGLTIMLTGLYILVMIARPMPLLAYLPLLVLIAALLIAHEQAPFIRDFLPVLMPVPAWYADIMARTTAYERRRLAYMWLALPRRMRLHYNSHDAEFLRWADLVIAATIL